MIKLTELKEWRALFTHQKTIATGNMQEWFAKDPQRFERFSLNFKGLLLDYSKNRVTVETLGLLINLAHARNLKSQMTGLFTGLMLNSTEKRAALHTALRTPKTETLFLQGRNIILDIHQTLDKMRDFTQKIREQTWLGVTGKPITDIINIGIGGSHLGPLLTVHALSDYADKNLRCHFISNIDSAHIHEVLLQINPETTLFIVSSKSFSTLETIMNATTLKNWFKDRLQTNDLSANWVAITANIQAAIEFEIKEENIFPLWDWIGGRFSIWSSIGLPLAILIGMDNFDEFLRGAHAMDQHFYHAPFEENMPVILALLSIWYINFFGTQTHAIVPYSHHLNYLRLYLQQLEMESNGKNVSEKGSSLDFNTSSVIFGEQGCNGQHAFHQLLHQGQHFIPVDFILVGFDKHGLEDHLNLLIGSGLSQAQALMLGKSFDEAYLELQMKGYSKEESLYLAKHKTVTGNRPSNIIFLDKISPFSLGSLLALYEHRTFVQGVIWQINSFDQWGVELGKKLLPNILQDLKSSKESKSQDDSSTIGLIKHFKNMRNKNENSMY
jgi:glucose-6-phosphate isomerase